MMKKGAALLAFLVVAHGHKDKKPAVMSKSCPKGYSLEGKQCISRRYEDATAYCSDAGELLGNKCADFYAPQKSCPLGWSANGKSCVRTTSAARYATCYNGYTLENDSCVAWKELPLVPECSVGYLEGDVCLLVEEEDAQFACPADAEYDKGTCYGTETYECAPSKKSAYGRWLGKRKNFRPAYQSSNFGKKTHYKAPVVQQSWCTRRVDIPLMEFCSEGWNRTGSKCTRTTVTDPDFVCPVPHSKGCLERTSTPADYRCPAGFTDSGKSDCYKTETSEAEWHCHGNAQLYGDRCVIYSTPAIRCENGTMDGKGKCLILETADATVTYGKY